jgi:DNA-3-methyladenine glycosylase I
MANYGPLMALTRAESSATMSGKSRSYWRTPAIVRNRLKISATVQNARAFLKVQSHFGSFDAFIWQFVGGKPLQHAWRTIQDIPAKTAESDAMSKELKRRGFPFVGSTMCYAFMQAVGMVNDPIVECCRWQEVQSLAG